MVNSASAAKSQLAVSQFHLGFVLFQTQIQQISLRHKLQRRLRGEGPATIWVKIKLCWIVGNYSKLKCLLSKPTSCRLPPVKLKLINLKLSLVDHPPTYASKLLNFGGNLANLVRCMPAMAGEKGNILHPVKTIHIYHFG